MTFQCARSGQRFKDPASLFHHFTEESSSYAIEITGITMAGHNNNLAAGSVAFLVLLMLGMVEPYSVLRAYPFMN